MNKSIKPLKLNEYDEVIHDFLIMEKNQHIITFSKINLNISNFFYIFVFFGNYENIKQEF